MKQIQFGVSLFVILSLTANAQCSSPPPANTDWGVTWIKYQYANGTGVKDPSDNINPSSTNVIDDGTASAYIAFKNDVVYFRLLLAGDPGIPGSGLDNYVWMTEIRDSLGTLLISVMLDGNNSAENIKVINPAANSTQVIYSLATSSYAAMRTVGSGYYYLDWQVPMCSLQYWIGSSGFNTGNITMSSTLYFAFGTSSAANTSVINKDHAHCADAGSGVPACAGYNLLSGLSSAQLSSIATGGALPVELLSFSGAFVDGQVQLRWRTATETNCYGFEIERKSANGDWSYLETVQGSGNSNTPKTYSYLDKFLPTFLPSSVEPIRYRLRIIDRDGSWDYSNVLAIFSSNQAVSASIYPNPGSSKNTFSVTYPIDTPSDVTLEVQNTLGQTVQTVRQGHTDTGEHTTAFYGQNLQSGLHYVCIKQGGILTRVVPFLVIH